MDEAFLRLSHQFFKTAFWEEERPFSRAEAWLDCLNRAAFRPYRKLVGADLVEIPEGAFTATETSLAQQWGWSRTKAHTFLSMLEKWQMISLQKAGPQLLISLCNCTAPKPEKSTKKAQKRPASSGAQASEEPRASGEKAPLLIEEEKEDKEVKEDEEEKEEAASLPLDSSLAPALPEVRETARQLGIDETIAEAFFHSRQKRPRSPGGLWTNKRGEAITDWPADLQAFAKFWMQNLRTGQPWPAAAAPGGDPPRPIEAISRFGF